MNAETDDNGNVASPVLEESPETTVVKNLLIFYEFQHGSYFRQSDLGSFSCSLTS